VVDLSSGEEDDFPDTSRAEEFAMRLFGDLNRGLLGPPGDDNVLILNDSDEGGEVCEEDTIVTIATPPFVVNFPAPTVSATDADDAFGGKQDNNGDGGDEVGSP
jgi:hypothetical protein